MSEANKEQIGGRHYKTSIEHWDYVVANDLDYFQGQITKYVTRWKRKGGLSDLLKARHFLDKYIEVETVRPELGAAHPAPVASRFRLHSEFSGMRICNDCEQIVPLSQVERHVCSGPTQT